MMGEYDAGYENYIDSLIREIEKLQDENDKLREQVSSLVGRSFRTADKMSCIEADNAKLRELVRDAWGDGHPDRSCDGCDIRDECHDDAERMRKDGVLRFSRCLFEQRIEERMRELGVVDE